MSAGIIALIIVLVLAAGVGVFLAGPVARSRRLKKRFGPEYERVAGEGQNRRLGEAELAKREERVRGLELTALTAPARDNYTAQWAELQERFVDTPGEATADAEGLVGSVIRDLGYPDDDFEQMVADLSVHHAGAVGDLRAAHYVAGKSAAGEASTEELRVALLHYRELFTELLADSPAAASDEQEDDEEDEQEDDQETAVATAVQNR
jgi:hypothetical protein